MPAVYNLLEGDSGTVCGRLESLLDVGASQVRQWAPLLKPAAQRRLNITVDVPMKKRCQLNFAITRHLESYEAWPAMPAAVTKSEPST